MDKLRLLYTQTGRAVWMSHLDVMRTLQRALLRADVPLRYSEGFNPHALISVLMPLSVGTASLCQMADIRVRSEVDLAGLPERLNAVMPDGLRVREAYEGGEKGAELKWLCVEGVWEYDAADPAVMAARCLELFSGRVEVLRRTKRGEAMFPLTDHIQKLSFAPEEGLVRVSAVISGAEPVVNPELLTAAVAFHCPEAAPDGSRFCRLALLKTDGTAFR